MACGRMRQSAWVSAVLAAIVGIPGGCAAGSTADAVDGGPGGGADVTTAADVARADGSSKHDGSRSDASIFHQGSNDATADVGDTTDGATPPSDGAAPADTGGSSGQDTGGGTGQDAGCPAGMAGPGCTTCASGFHLCGATCTADGPNDPSTGCSQSCGAGACPASGGEVASCTAAGVCSVACPAGTTVCSGSSACSQCCTNADCSGSTPECTGGTCVACPPDLGTCVTACDTDLTTNSNCGTCGNSCSYNAVTCLLIGIACGCEGSGSDISSYACD